MHGEGQWRHQPQRPSQILKERGRGSLKTTSPWMPERDHTPRGLQLRTHMPANTKPQQPFMRSDYALQISQNSRS